MKCTCFIALLISISFYSNAQLKIDFDYSNAIETIDFFKKNNPSLSEIEQLVATAGVKIIIKKIRSTDSIAKKALYKAANNIKAVGKEKDFQFEFIKKNLPAIEDFIVQIKNKQQTLADSIQALAGYLPSGKTASIKVCFLMGGFSSGFTKGNDNNFYIGTHQYQNDFIGIINTCQHELFHNIQSISYDRDAMLKKLQDAKELPALYAAYLLQNVFIEGSAEYIADITKMDTTSVFIKRQMEHAAVNNYRMEDNFFLIENIVTNAYTNPEKMDADAAYRVLFDWNWNNPGYAVGKLMCKALVKEYGTGTIKKYLGIDPIYFVKDYILLAKSNSQIYPYHFSEDFEKMVNTVVEKMVGQQGK